MSKKIGIITIGQSPRTDVLPEMSAFFPEGVEVLEQGALDGLTPQQVRAFAPEAVTRLPFTSTPLSITLNGRKIIRPS